MKTIIQAANKLTSKHLPSLSQRLEKDVRAIALKHGRRVGMPGHKVTIEYLVSRLDEIGCLPYQGKSYRLPYTVDDQEFTNIVGLIPGKNPSGRPLLIGAHYDSPIDAPCADDNAAAVAITLAIAEYAANTQNHGGFDRDIIIAIFDSEEQPYSHTAAMGSNHFYNHQMKAEGVHAALIMDLVGHDISTPFIGGHDLGIPFLKNILFVTGTESHPGLLEIMRQHPKPSGLKIMPALNRCVGDMSDHGVFRQNGTPYLFLSCGRWAHYHKPTDTPNRLNYKKMAHITHYIEQVMTGMDRTPMRRGCEETFSETLEFEISQLKSILGLAYKPILKRIGVGEISTRKDMDQFAEYLLDAGI